MSIVARNTNQVPAAQSGAPFAGWRNRGLIDRCAALFGRHRLPLETDACDRCDSGTMRVVASEREVMMGEIGPTVETVRCDNADCGHTDQRLPQNG